MGLFGGKSEARQKAERYAKLAKALEDEISRLEEDISDEKESLSSSHEKFIAYPDSAEGLIMESFETHEENWKRKYEIVIGNMETGVQSLKILKDSAGQLAADWKRVADMEDMNRNAGF